jgi:hypothetical protein
MTQPINLQRSLQALAAYFPIDQKSSERIKSINIIIQEIKDPELIKCLSNKQVSQLELAESRIDRKTFFAVQRILFRQEIDQIIQGGVKCILNNFCNACDDTVFLQILLEETKKVHCFQEILRSLIKFPYGEKDNYRIGASLCFCWAESRKELEELAEELNQSFAKPLIKTDQKKNHSFDLLTLAKTSKLAEWTSRISRFDLTGKEKLALAKALIVYQGYNIFRVIHFFSFDVGDTALFLELAKTASESKAGHKLYLKEFWMTLPLTVQQKKELFDIFYSGQRGLCELFGSLEYFGWDLNNDKAEIFRLIKESINLSDMPDLRPFSFSAPQRAELAYEYSIHPMMKYLFNPKFFDKLPLEDVEADQLFPILHQLAPHKIVRHLPRFSLKKEQIIRLLKLSAPFDPDTVKYLTTLGLDPLKDKEEAIKILSFLKEPGDMQNLFRVCAFFDLSAQERFTLITQLSTQKGITIILEAYRIGFIETAYLKDVSKMLMSSCSGTVSSPFFQDLASFNFPKEQLFTILNQLIETNLIVVSLFENLDLLGLHPIKDAHGLLSLIKQELRSNPTPDCLFKAGLLGISKEAKLNVALEYAKVRKPNPVKVQLSLLAQWGIDIYQEQDFLFKFLMVLNPYKHQEIVFSHFDEYSLTIEQKREVFTRYLADCSSALDYLVDCNNDFIPNQNTLVTWIKQAQGSVRTIIKLLKKYSFSIESKHEIIKQCAVYDPRTTYKSFNEFGLSYPAEEEFALAIISKIAKTFVPKLKDFPFTVEKKCQILEKAVARNFSDCLYALKELKLDAQTFRTAFLRLVEKFAFGYVEVLSHPIDFLIPLLDDPCFSETDLRQLAQSFFLVSPAFVFKNMSVFHLDPVCDRTMIVGWVKSSPRSIECFSEIVSTTFLTKEEQAALFLSKANTSGDHFFKLLLQSAIDPVLDREMFLHIIYKNVQLTQYVPLSLKKSITLNKKEWQQLAKIQVEKGGMEVFLEISKYGLNWNDDREFLEELLYDCARLGYLKNHFISDLHRLPLSLPQKHKIVLTALSTNPTLSIIKDLHLLEWDPVRDRKILWKCWKVAAQHDTDTVISCLKQLPYGKEERIALAKICAKYGSSALIYDPRSFMLDPLEDSQALFELAVCLFQRKVRISNEQILAKLGINIDPKQTVILSLLTILNRPSDSDQQPILPSSSPFADVLKTLQNKLPDYAEEDWAESVNKLVKKCQSFFPAFDPFFCEHLLSYFSKSRLTHQNFAAEVHRSLQCAIDTPNRIIKSEVLSLLFIPLVNVLVKEDSTAISNFAYGFNFLIAKGQTATLPFRLYLFKLFGEEKETVKMAERFDKVYNSLDKPGKSSLLQGALGFMQNLYKDEQLGRKEKWRLFLQIFSSDMVASIAKASKQGVKEYAKPLEIRLQLAKIILRCSVFRDYLRTKNPAPIEAYFFYDLPKKVSLLIPGLLPQEFSSIQKFWFELESRSFESFFNYCGSLQNLADKGPLLTLWKDFLLAAAEGESLYRDWRYKKTPYCAHWEKLSSFSHILEQWQLPQPVSEKLTCNFSASLPDYQSIFFQKIIQDVHLTNVERLSAYLKNIEFFGIEETNQASALFQTKAIEFLAKCESKQITTNQDCKPWLETLKKLLVDFSSKAEFLNDLAGLIRFTQRSSEEKTLQAYVTDDPIHLFLCGAEIYGSCQRPDGQPDLNKCLLGYLTNPYIKMVALVNDKGRLEARAIVKLLMAEMPTPQGKQWQPVLFLERSYPSTISEEEIQIIWQVAKGLADRLKVPLAANNPRYRGGEREKTCSVGPTLSCFGGVAPYEYSDASRGVKHGTYDINDAFYWNQ